MNENERIEKEKKEIMDYIEKSIKSDPESLFNVLEPEFINMPESNPYILIRGKKILIGLLEDKENTDLPFFMRRA